MVAIVSLLDDQYTDKLNDLIQKLEQKFGLTGVQITPYPHLTWLTANDGSLTHLQAALSHAAGVCCKFKIRTTGLGVFPGEKPVLFLPVLRTPAVNHFHSHLFDAVKQISQETGPKYHPDFWLPHLSLALGDTSPEVISQAILYLNDFDFDWELELDNLALLTKHGDKFLPDGVFPLLESQRHEGLTVVMKTAAK